MIREAELFDVPVRGGALRTARWRGRDGAPVVIAAHGVTANYVHFALLADVIGDDATLVAPDLRGRGGSNALPGPFGMRAHAGDMAAVLDHLSVDRAVFLGHSMGGFVVPAAAVLHPDRVSAIVVVDGGLQVIEPPPDADIEALTSAVIGPSLDRLRMTFPTREAYHDFWRPHPALREVWANTPDFMRAYLDYDLVPAPNGELRSSVSLDAVLRDSTDTLLDVEILDAIERVTQPFTFLWAARGVFDETPGLYSEEKVARLQRAVPQVECVHVDANHYTMLFGSGVHVVAEHVRKAAGV